jgi:hypothetical protein
MKLSNFIKEVLIAVALLISGVALAVQLPSTSYIAPEYSSEYSYQSSEISGPTFPSKAYFALRAGADDCSIVEGDPDACKTCCENAYGRCVDECSDPDSDECKECQQSISACKKEKCDKSLPLDGGEWVLIIIAATSSLLVRKKQNELS